MVQRQYKRKAKPLRRRLPFAQRLICYDLDELHRMIEVVESGVHQESTDFGDWVRRTAEGLDDDQQAEQPLDERRDGRQALAGGLILGGQRLVGVVGPAKTRQDAQLIRERTRHEVHDRERLRA